MEYLTDLIYVIPLLFIAGVLDGIAGGGGLIALPAYLLTGMPVHNAYACNKLQSGLGTLTSALKYIKEDLADIKASLIALPFTMIFSFITTKLILQMDNKQVKQIITICIPLTIIMMILKRKLTTGSVKKQSFTYKTVCLLIVSGIILGAYDSLFGPGGGTIAMILFSLLLNYDLRVGCGNGKIIIVAANITAVFSYICSGYMLWHIAIPASVANMAGSYIGAAIAVKKGEKIVLPAMLIVIAMLTIQTFLGAFG